MRDDVNSKAARTAKLVADVRALIAAGHAIFARDAATMLVRLSRPFRPSPGPYGSELAAELTAAAYPELDLAIDRDEVGWHWLRAATNEEAPMR